MVFVGEKIAFNREKIFPAKRVAKRFGMFSFWFRETYPIHLRNLQVTNVDMTPCFLLWPWIGVCLHPGSQWVNNLYNLCIFMKGTLFPPSIATG